MKNVHKYINKAYELLKVEEKEEKAIISIVILNNTETLKSKISLIVDGNKITMVKAIREMLKEKDSGAEELIEILEMIKDNI